MASPAQVNKNKSPSSNIIKFVCIIIIQIRIYVQNLDTIEI